VRISVKIAGGVLLGAAASIIAFQVLQPREVRYEGKTINGWVKEWVLEGGHAESVLLQIGMTNWALRTQILEQRRLYVIEGLKTKDNALWKPYATIKRNLPGFLSNRLPDWPEPSYVRFMAVRNFSRGEWRRDESDNWELAVPALCVLVASDPDPKLRSMAFEGLSNLGLFSDEALPVMFKALGASDYRTRECAARWFGKTTPTPELVVPALLRGLEDPAAKSAFASALRRYGSRASFAVGPLLELAKTNDPAVSSVAKWALSGIDPEAAKRAEVRLQW